MVPSRTCRCMQEIVRDDWSGQRRRVRRSSVPFMRVSRCTMSWCRRPARMAATESLQWTVSIYASLGLALGHSDSCRLAKSRSNPYDRVKTGGARCDYHLRLVRVGYHSIVL
jgi:hypothetical protein